MISQISRIKKQFSALIFLVFGFLIVLIFSSVPVYGAGLISFWKLDEGSGTVAQNFVAGGPSGTLINGPTWTNGRVGKALSFDGIDDQVKVTSASLSNMTAMTLSAWVYPKSGGGNGTGRGRIISKSNNTDSTPKRFSLFIGDDNASVAFNAGYTVAGSWKTPAGSLAFNSWHQVTVTYTHGNPNNIPKIYIDGVLQILTTINTPSGNPVSDDSDLYIGSLGVTNSRVFDGTIDQVRIYNQELTSTEANSLYSSEAPNIIVIMTDDQRWDDMDVMPKTRSLIGDQGLTFTNSFVDFALCCPARASFLTGQAAHNSKVLGNSPDRQGGYQAFKPTENNSLPVWLKQIGYATAHMGKYLNGFSSTDGIPPGWSLWNGIADDQGGYKYYNYMINDNGILRTYGTSAADYKTDVQARKAADFITSQSSGQPFFLWLNPLTPHGKVPENISETTGPDPAPRHAGAFNSLSLPQPLSFNEADISDKPAFMKLLPQLTASGVDSITDKFRRRRESLLAVDDMVETIVNALQASGKLNNTYIVFTSDNGWMQGEHRRPQAKYVAYEESIRVPFLIRGPGIPAGQTRNQLVNNLDLVATIEELSGITPGRLPDGRSLVPLFQNPNAPWRTSLLIQGLDGNNFVGVADLPGRFQAVRTNRYKYIEHLSDAGVSEKEFYDLASDPYELISKHIDLSYASVIADLRNRLSILRSCVGSTCWITAVEPALPSSTQSPSPSPTPSFSPTPSPFPTPTPIPRACIFTRNLYLRSVGEDVRCLQKYLNSQGFTVSASSFGSPGNETNYFGFKTRQAVARWQSANNVFPTWGYFGPKSRAMYYKK